MIKVLFLAADPYDDAMRLRLDEEFRAIDAAIQRGPGREALEFVTHFAVRIRELQAVLLRHRPDVVHFAGHGDGEGGIVLGDDAGKPREVDREALDALFGALEHPPRVVVLNACDTMAAAPSADTVVDYTIGMNRPIEDTTAIVFAEAFYGALAARQTVARAFRLAVVQLRMEGMADAAKPTLHLRPGVDPAAPLVDADGARSGSEPPLVYENRLEKRDRDSTMSQTYVDRDPSGRTITYRNG